jgi:hypothetical protein
MLLTGSGDEICEPISALFQAVAYHWSGVSLSAFPAICLLKVHVEISSLLFPLLWCTASCLLCCMFVFSSLFIVQCFFFSGWGGQSVQGAMLFIPGVTVAIPRDSWCSPVGLPNVSQAVLERCLAVWEPSCFLSVTWCGEAFHRLGVQDVELLILLGALFPPSVAPVSQQYF